MGRCARTAGLMVRRGRQSTWASLFVLNAVVSIEALGVTSLLFNRLHWTRGRNRNGSRCASRLATALVTATLSTTCRTVPSDRAQMTAKTRSLNGSSVSMRRRSSSRVLEGRQSRCRVSWSGRARTQTRIPTAMCQLATSAAASTRSSNHAPRIRDHAGLPSRQKRALQLVARSMSVPPRSRQLNQSIFWASKSKCPTQRKQLLTQLLRLSRSLRRSQLCQRWLLPRTWRQQLLPPLLLRPSHS